MGQNRVECVVSGSYDPMDPTLSRQSFEEQITEVLQEEKISIPSTESISRKLTL